MTAQAIVLAVMALAQMEATSMVDKAHAMGTAVMPVFYSATTPDRGNKLKRWLAVAGGSWCHVELPPVLPEALDVVWEGTVDSPVVVINATSKETLFVIRPPFGRLGRQMERKLENDTSISEIDSGLAAAHKVANAVFHLRALQCLARRCHECVKSAPFAAIFEDDVEYVEGISPASAETFPRLLADAMRQVQASAGVNKLQLAVGNQGQPVNVAWRKAKCYLHPESVQGHARARLLRCSQYSDSHAYVLTRQHAEQITDTHAMLISQDGDGAGNCTNPWGHSTCGDDPAIFREFFSQCDGMLSKKERREQPKAAKCSGLVLASPHKPWSLLHNNTDKYRTHSATSHSGDSFEAITRLKSSLEMWRVLLTNASQLRNVSDTLKRALDKKVVRKTAKNLERQESAMSEQSSLDPGRTMRRLPMPLFFSPRTADHEARMRSWIDAGATDWCLIKVPPFNPELFKLEWEGSFTRPLSIRTTGHGSDAQKKLDINSSLPPRGGRLTLFNFAGPDYGNLRREAERGHRQPRYGLGSTRSMARAAFHMQALECFATRCHPCVADALAATVVEDDLMFIENASPGSAQGLPALLAAAMEQLDAEGSVSKLHLTVQPDKTAQSSNVPSRRARCLPASQRFEPQTAAAASGARLLRCTNFSQSQGYVVNYKRARWVIEAHHELIRNDGNGSGKCVNPWTSETCGSDPTIFRDYFKQCDTPNSSNPAGCVGLALGSASTTWTLRRNSSGSSSDMDSVQNKAVKHLYGALLSQAKKTNSLLPQRPRRQNSTASAATTRAVSAKRTNTAAYPLVAATTVPSHA